MGRACLKDIARRAGVSLSTASVVLNEKTGVPVAESTRRRVLRVAQRLGYSESRLARAITTALRHVGIGVGDLELASQSFTSLIFQGVHERLFEQRYVPMIQKVAQYRSENESDTTGVPTRIIRLHRARLIDGLIVDKQYFLNDEVRRLFEYGLPLVVVNGGIQELRPGAFVPTVTIDDRKGGYLAAMHLLMRGHRRIGLISRPYATGPRAFHSGPVYLFREGVFDALREAGVTPCEPWIAEGDLLDKSITAQAVRRVMSDPSGPTALVVGDDLMALMAINELRAMGLRVPGDVSVVGYGDLPIAQRLAEPALTTVAAPLLENGRRAAEKLVTIIETGSTAEPVTVLEPALVLRQSTATMPEKLGD